MSAILKNTALHALILLSLLFLPYATVAKDRGRLPSSGDVPVTKMEPPVKVSVPAPPPKVEAPKVETTPTAKTTDSPSVTIATPSKPKNKPPEPTTVDRGETTNGPIHSRYKDGTPVYKGQQPGKIQGPISDTPHSILQRDNVNNRIYKSREYGENNVPVKDIDFTNPTFPNGKLRPNHTIPEQHKYIANDPNNPKAGYKRGPGGPLEVP